RLAGLRRLDEASGHLLDNSPVVQELGDTVLVGRFYRHVIEASVLQRDRDLERHRLQETALRFAQSALPAGRSQHTHRLATPLERRAPQIRPSLGGIARFTTDWYAPALLQ